MSASHNRSVRKRAIKPSKTRSRFVPFFNPGKGYPLSPLEVLEDRTLLAVNPTLMNGLLSVGMNAANDAATISMIGSSIDVFDGSKHTPFALSAVSAINVQGNASPGQSVDFKSSISVAGMVNASALNSIVFEGAYQGSSETFSANAIQFNLGSSLKAMTGDLSLSVPDSL